jgi:hypothetical protein
MKLLVLLVLPALLMACKDKSGIENNSRHFQPAISNSSASTSFSSSKKSIQLEFFDNGCISKSNEDAITIYAFKSNQFRMYSWNCVTEVQGDTALKKLDIFLKFDTNLGCFKREQDNRLLVAGALYDDSQGAICTEPAKSVTAPELKIDIDSFNVAILTQTIDGAQHYTFIPTFSYRNTGNLALTQYTVLSKATNIDTGENVSTFQTSNHNIIVPGERTSESNLKFDFGELTIGSRWDITVRIANYYGDEVASRTIQVTVN